MLTAWLGFLFGIGLYRAVLNFEKAVWVFGLLFLTAWVLTGGYVMWAGLRAVL